MEKKVYLAFIKSYEGFNFCVAFFAQKSNKEDVENVCRGNGCQIVRIEKVPANQLQSHCIDWTCNLS